MANAVIEEEEFSDFQGFEDESGLESTDDEAEKVGELARKATEHLEAPKPGAPTGVVYFGRIPHGFYEDQLRKYLQQFGEIKNLRLSRNKHTGKSKHYAFVEFADREVAKIVCEVMNNYLLSGHLLKARLMDPKEVHPQLFKGANKHFHAIPWGLVNKQRSERKHSREYWEERQREFEAYKKQKFEELAAKGIRY